MKKIKNLFIVTLALFLFNSVSALEIIDVKRNYWASQEIINAIQRGYIYVIDNNKFVPEGTMTRSEFASALLRAVRRQNEPLVQSTSFKDITNKTPDKKSIILSEQIRMAFGYPDKTFKPNAPISHNEAMSMIANVTNGDYVAADITNFSDYDEIPIWARRAYIKNVANNIYVNHPDEDKFTPDRNLTRAEAAVLFDRLALNLDKVKDNYRDLYDEMPDDDSNQSAYNFDEAVFIADNTLELAPFATNNKVKIFDKKKIIEAGNILVGTSLNEVKTRKHLIGHGYTFTAPNDIYTKEGTFLYPKGTEFYARVYRLGYSAWRSKPEKSRFVFYKYSLPNGETYDMAGVPYTKNEKIVYAKGDTKSIKKVANYANTKTSNKNYLIECAHQMAPLTEFNIKDNKTIYILLTGDMVIPQNEEFMNLRTEPSLLEENI